VLDLTVALLGVLIILPAALVWTEARSSRATAPTAPLPPPRDRPTEHPV
jgi:hypothetical protein